MRILFRATITATLAAVVTVAGGALYSSPLVAEAQHGTGGDRHTLVIDISSLELTDAQRAAVETPLRDAFMTLQEVRRLHTKIAAELTEEQRPKLAAVFRDALGDWASQQPLVSDSDVDSDGAHAMFQDLQDWVHGLHDNGHD